MIPPEKTLDAQAIARMIAALDRLLNRQLDEILHHEAFQRLESAWGSLQHLLERTSGYAQVKIELLSASKRELWESFEDSPELIQSALYEHVYVNVYSMPGADPYAAIIADYEFENTPEDMVLLRHVSQVAAQALCPFIASVGPAFFGQASMEELEQVPDLPAFLEQPAFAEWNAYRDTQEARFVGLVLGRFLLRPVYRAEEAAGTAFRYGEGIQGRGDLLWSSAAYLFAVNLARAFAEDGFCLQIRGVDAGGRMEEMPAHHEMAFRGQPVRSSADMLYREQAEFERSILGFIPFCYVSAAVHPRVGKDFACFFSAQSTQRPQPPFLDDESAFPNLYAPFSSRLNACLPYLFIATRFMQYLRVIGRENLGARAHCEAIERYLDAWLQERVEETWNPRPTPEEISRRPLRAAEVRVRQVSPWWPDPGRPYVRLHLTFVPGWFQLSGLDLVLRIDFGVPIAQ